MLKQMKSSFHGLRGTFFLVLIALTVRWGIAEAYVIPTGSMEPTLQVGDRIFINKMAYGVRVPFSKVWLTKFTEPQRGDVIVFKYPGDENIFYVKRVIGLPGDEVEYTDKGELFVNQQKIDESKYETKLTSEFHQAFGPVHVPEHQLFMMGDNRDNSSDSRVWGFLPEENILGKAVVQWFGYIR